LIKNMTLCVEPMLMTDSDRYIIDSKNKWTVIARNKKMACHVEHMIVINEKGCEILTE
jgi:methionyl aminopeptidase